ncbi:MAG: ferritin-like domain-containing protein, partial [Gallicola sp.]|nr:ferritin-like domain-containing protein [Gallicola sp.]
MELSKKLQDLLNRQVQREYGAAFLYNGMRIYFKDLGIPGATHWMTIQTKEELEHAEDFIEFILDVDGDVELRPLEEEPTGFESLLDVYEKGLEHEKL